MAAYRYTDETGDWREALEAWSDMERWAERSAVSEEGAGSPGAAQPVRPALVRRGGPGGRGSRSGADTFPMASRMVEDVRLATGELVEVGPGLYIRKRSLVGHLPPDQARATLEAIARGKEKAQVPEPAKVLHGEMAEAVSRCLFLMKERWAGHRIKAKMSGTVILGRWKWYR